MKPIVIITGLAHFGRKISAQLNHYDPSTRYLFLDTYYNNIDRLKYLCLIWFADTVYSINGAVTGSLVIQLAIFLRKRVVMHWVGSDLIQAEQRVAENKFKRSFVDHPLHLTDTPWYVPRLKTIGIRAQYTPMLTLEATEIPRPFPEAFAVLAYVPTGKEQFYGLPHILEAAVLQPEVPFLIAGLDPSGHPLPPNVKALGWIHNMKPLFDQSVVSVRIPEHDGLSFFVLETLAHGRYAIYNQPFEHALTARNGTEVAQAVGSFKTQFDNGLLPINQQGYQHVKSNFAENEVLLMLKNHLQKNGKNG